MAKFIELTQVDGNRFSADVDLIKEYREHEDGLLVFIQHKEYTAMATVTESYEQVKALIESLK